jgi:hypothetical protein
MPAISPQCGRLPSSNLNMLEHLPFDILFSVIQLVTIADILSLRLVITVPIIHFKLITNNCEDL